MPKNGRPTSLGAEYTFFGHRPGAKKYSNLIDVTIANGNLISLELQEVFLYHQGLSIFFAAFALISFETFSGGKLSRLNLRAVFPGNRFFFLYPQHRIILQRKDAPLIIDQFLTRITWVVFSHTLIFLLSSL